MKQGWEIKKLGEVCEVICGQDYKAVKDDNGKYPIYGTGGVMGYASQYRCPSNSVIIGRKGSINNPLFVETEFWNVDTAFGVVPNKEVLCPKFFFLFCKSFDFTRLDVSVTIPSLRRVDILQIPIPVPPLPVQEQIVSELDLLSGIIEKKRKQLKELDALAQSIFYDMFGDPITNEKGWEVKKLGEVADIVGGSTPKTNIKEYWNGDNYWVTPAELHGTRYISSTERCITDLAVDKAHLTQLPIGTVLLSSRAPIGKVCITRVPMYCNQGFKNIICSNKLNSEYVYQYLIDKTEFLKSLGTGATFKEISKTTTENITIPIPPLPLQRQFASKIEAIEKQKELIKQSISETETLFNARMQHYFN